MAAAFTHDDLLELAGEPSYRRGEGYVGSVTRMRLRDGALRAVVLGSEPYRVRLTAGSDGLEGDCECPHAEGGFFCKHLVAVGIAKLDGVEQDSGAADEDQRVEVLYGYLSQLGHTELIDLLLDAAADDEVLEQQLLAEAFDRGDSGE